MPTKLIKTTVLPNHYLSSGWDDGSFFDEHLTSDEHNDAEQSSAFAKEWDAWWEKHAGDPSYDDKGNYIVYPDEPTVQPLACRSFLFDLIPSAAEGKKGRWTITIEFEPEEELNVEIDTSDFDKESER